MATSLQQDKEETPAPHHGRYGEFAAILSSLSAVPFIADMPSLAVLAPVLVLAIKAGINRIMGRSSGGIPFACRRMIFYALIFVAFCFCAQLVFSLIPGLLAEAGMQLKHLLVLLGWINVFAYLIAIIGLIMATVHCCLLLKKAEQ